MGLAEPSSPLWTAVKGIYDSWPPDDETVAAELAGSWRRGAQVVATGAGQASSGGAQAVAAWLDAGGEAMGTRVDGVVRQLRAAEPGTMALADRAQGYAGALASMKATILATVAVNDAAYTWIGGLPAGGVLQRIFAAQVAVLLRGAEAAAAAGLTAPPAAAGAPGAAPAGGFVPAPGATPEQILDQWNALPFEERERILRDHPESIGNLDGIPVWIRNRANHVLLDRAIAATEAELDRLVRSQVDPTDIASNGEIAKLREKLDGLRLIKDTVSPLDEFGQPIAAPGQPPMYLIGLDPAGDGKAITSLGDPDTAANVATYIPGASSSLRPDELSPNIGWHRSLYDAVPPGAADTAVVMWLGYDPPHVAAAPFVGLAPAMDAADDLKRFQDGLAATHVGPDGTTTIVGYSYGGAVANVTADRYPDLATDRLVLLGAPGGTANTVADLGIDDPQGVYAAGDLLSDVAGRIETDAGPIDVLGPNPDTPEFGAQILDSPSISHFKYFEQGDAVRHDVGRIIAGGRPD